MKQVSKQKILSFLWQHILLLLSLFIMTFGVSLSVRSNLGSSVISTIPFVFTLAGQDYMAPPLTIGEYTNLMNAIFVVLQIIVLRRRFELTQLFQLVIGFFFGALLDLNMLLTGILVCDSFFAQFVMQVAGCTILGFGIALEIRCNTVTMPGEGISVALSRVTGVPFPKMKIIIDITLVIIAISLGYLFFGRWLGNVVGIGTLFAMVYVGVVVKYLNPRLGWFDGILCYIPGFRRYIFGLARFIYRPISGVGVPENTENHNEAS